MIKSAVAKPITVHNMCLSVKGHILLEYINLKINAGGALAITGGSGSGKTSLAKLISGKIKPSKGVLENTNKTVFVTQQDQFSQLSGMASTYYSKRYEFHEYEKQLGVKAYLEQLNKTFNYTSAPIEDIPLLKTFNVAHLLDRNLMQLSNGERKRLQLVSAFFQRPEVLLMDQPFTGLDVASRTHLSAYLETISKSGISIIIICGVQEVPDFFTQVLVLENGKAIKTGIPSEIKKIKLPSKKINSTIEVDNLLKTHAETYQTIIKMKDVCVSMKGKGILENINWEVKPGDCWALLGHNGAGKSTLLSLVTADNPQGYNNDLVLFDKQRGSGESIWDIKKSIGFLSPELHLYFMRGKGVLNSVPGISTQAETYSTLTCMDAIISGFNDEVGTVSVPTGHQKELALQWLTLVGLLHLKEVLFIHASLGEQRVLLLLRALIKSPALLILDEPCQGMDASQILYFKQLLDHICTSKHITLVYVSHKKEEIPNCVTKVLTLSKGRVI
ncbi:ATP-binding cassette domain-containing protein [Galbibacter sp. PAP.153]|uniref:ATP-binding cassette domain-containing protein n=1 Tax=Galbibacter sp. PAP.153 TaxID=3104623 RepID=UPI003008346F